MPSLCWSFGTAIATIVWSMKVIATANTIAARTRFLDAASSLERTRRGR